MPFQNKSILSVKKVLSLAWQSQMDSATEQWYRMCYSSSSTMLCEYIKPGCLKDHPQRHAEEQLDDFYLRILNQKFGDSTDTAAQLAMHRYLGVNTRFSTSGSRETLEYYLDKGFPVMTGQLHHGYYTTPNPTKSHWTICVGWTPENDSFVFHDPAGNMDVTGGGYMTNDGKYRKYPWAQWQRRWMADNSGHFVNGTGWCVTPVVDKSTGKYVPLKVA